MKKDTLLMVGVALSLLLSGYAAIQSHLAAASMEAQISSLNAANKSMHVSSVTDGGENAAAAGRAANREGAGRLEKPGPQDEGGNRSAGGRDVSGSLASGGAQPDASAEMTAEEKQAMEDAIADAVDAKLREQEAEKAEREKNRERTEWGEWKAPIDDLAADLNLDTNQKAAATEIFDRARDKFTELIAVKRPDGTSVLSDFAEDLKNGVPQEDAVKDFQYAIQHDLVPGTETSILSELLSIKDDVTTQLGEHLDRNQLTEYKKLKVDSLQVETGYEPIRDYIVDYMKE